jgi:CTP synthase
VEGKIAAATFAIEEKIPYLGLCLGMQTAVIALARHIGLEHANSTEMNEDTPHPVIDIMADQKDIVEKGGTMRLGNYLCKFDPKSKSRTIYGAKEVSERHRHRYEFNNAYRSELVGAGLRLAGLSPDEKLVEVIELDNHPFFIGSQFHPEYKSRPNRPHPLFHSFTQAAIAYRTAATHTDTRLKVKK